LDLSKKYNKKPPAKRPNFIKLGFNSPFQIPWPELFAPDFPLEDIRVLRENVSGYLYGKSPIPPGSLFCVWLLMIGGTTPRDRARIYHPDYNSEENERVIGFVTCGKFCWKQGQCKAVGFCRADVVRDILSKRGQDEGRMEGECASECHVTIRNVQSQWYLDSVMTLTNITF